jgi:hypothetical protein
LLAQGKTPTKNFVCDACLRSYTNKSGLKEHLKNCDGKPVILIPQITTHDSSKHEEYIHPFTKAKLGRVKCSTIDPFTIQTVRKRLAENAYTFDLYYKKGIFGLKTFLVSMIAKGDDRNYICVDESRKIFYRLDENRKWVRDIKGCFIYSVFIEMRDCIKSYTERVRPILAQIDTTGDGCDKTNEFVKMVDLILLDDTDSQFVDLVDRVILLIMRTASVP